MITFPLYDFDLSDYVAFKEPGKCYQYDLFGIVVRTPRFRYKVIVEPLRLHDWGSLHRDRQERQDR